MTITPEQARELLDWATPGPWEALFDNEAIETDKSTVLYNTDGAVEWGRNIEHDVPLAAAAPDLAQTIAGMEYEYRTEEWSGAYWYPCELWTSDLSQYDGYTERKGERLVRRLVGPVEVTE